MAEPATKAWRAGRRRGEKGKVSKDEGGHDGVFQYGSPSMGMCEA